MFFCNELKTNEWKIQHSSLAKISKTHVTYEQCRKYACEDIVRNLTHLPDDLPFVWEIPENEEFHFIGRVDDSSFADNNPIHYYKMFQNCTFAAFSTINKKNISRYRGGKIFFVYDILPEDIVHIFPVDSDTDLKADSEEILTSLPSLWLTMQDLKSVTTQLQVYDQITCKTKRNGQILKPFAVIAFDELDEYTQKIAKDFEIGCIIVHPDKKAINYSEDLLGTDYFQLMYVSEKMNEFFGLETLKYHYYF